MKKITFTLFAFLLVLIGFAQTETLAEWTPTTMPGGTDDFGTSPFVATTTANNLVVGGLTRGSGIGTTGTGAQYGWGGNDFTATSIIESIDENEFVTFTLTADTGYTFSIESIAPYNVRRSGTGPTEGQWQYQIDGGSFTDIDATITWGSTTSNAGNNKPAIDLSDISELQNIDAGTTVTFRLLLWGASGAGGTWYFNGHNNATNKTLTVLGSVEGESGSTPLNYCQINEDYSDVEEITSVVFGDDTTITNTNNIDILVDFTSTVADVEQGENYTITVKGNSYGEFDNEYVAFIDWNQNGILDDTGEVYYIGLIYDSTGYDSQSASTTISVPTTALLGETRIRITKTYTDVLFDAYLNIDPCYISMEDDWWEEIYGSYGQALDFTINVLAADPCAGITAPTGDDEQDADLGDTLADLDVTATGTLTWYSDSDLTSVISDTTEVVDGATYYVINTEGDCESEALAVTVTIIETDPCVGGMVTPTFSQVSAICVGDVLVPLPTASTNGITGTWSPALDNTQTTEYTFTPDAEQCAETTTMTITANPTTTPTFTQVDTICAGDDLVPLPTSSLNGVSGTWSPALNNMETTTYEFTPDAGQCAVTVTMTIVVNVAAVPTVESPQTLSEGQMVADIIVTGVTGTLNWYDENGNVVDASTVLTEGTYMFEVTQTIDGCESYSTDVIVEVTLSTTEFDNNSFRAYPNPVKDFYNISYNKEITNVSVVNMLGQTILNQAVNSTTTQIDMTRLPSGNYFVKVNVDGAVKILKVIK